MGVSLTQQSNCHWRNCRDQGVQWLEHIIRLPVSDGTWCYSRRVCVNDPAQGWKLHVSATILSAEKIFRRVVPILHKYDALFKVPLQSDLLLSLNAGLSDFSQIGKFMTVYPRSIDEAVNLARELHRATRDLPGPRIPFDAQYRHNSLVHYRYGAFRALGKGTGGLLRMPSGRLVADRRAPGRAIPRWLADPFKPQERLRTPKGPIGVDFIAFKARMQRGKGGIYEALDLSVSPARLVIIKEGRRHGEVDDEGKDGYARLQHEAKVLRRLRRAGVPVPNIFREFSQNGNRYLVLEKISGRPLIPANRIQPVRISWRLAARTLDQLRIVLSGIHAAGWVWRDCKPSHIFGHRGQFWLIDFENACRINQKKVSAWGSRHYVPPIAQKTFPRQSGTAEDDYALGVIAFQFGTGKFPPVKKSARARLYRQTQCPDPLRKRIDRLLAISARRGDCCI